MARITWLGHAAFHVVLDDKNVLLDPWLSNPLAPAELPDPRAIELIVVTHAHGDHLGETLEIMKKSKRAKLVAIYELAEEIAESGVERERVIGGNIGGPIRTGVGNIEVALVPASHSSPRGCPVGAVLIGREAVIYHAGDTGLSADMQWIGELYAPDVALLPIGGHFTMDPKQAAYAVKLIKPRIAVPMHYGTFPMLYGTPEEFEREVAKVHPVTRVAKLRPGETLEI
ncbi:MAG: metal-dependent hydrolase [Fervidicoccaceae archaeon]